MLQSTWNSTPAVAGFYGVLILLALGVSLVIRELRESLLRKRLKHVQEIRRGTIGLAVSVVYSLAAWVSLPAGVLHTLWVGDRRDQPMRNRIDVWVLTWLAIILALVMLGWAGKRPLLALLPVMRIADISYTLILVLVFPKISSSPSPARPLILLIIHLTELALSFSVFYQIACAAGNLKVDGAICCSAHFGGRDALYFSLVTAATVGFGDVTALNGARWITVSQILLSLFLTLISIPRVFNNYPARPEE